MNSSYGLKTRAQFQNLDKKKEKWVSIRAQAEAQLRFQNLIGSQWPRWNCALENSEDSELWNAETMGEEQKRQVDNHSMAADRLITLAQTTKGLSAEDLLGLHGLMLTGNPQRGHYRECRISPLTEGHQPTEFEILPEVVRNALEWFNSDSFLQMHEVEQAALFLMKLLDVLPFQQGNGKTLRLAANLFLLRNEFPPAPIASSRAGEYHTSITSAFKFHTQPLIDLLADSVLESLCYCLGETTPLPKFLILQ